ncbi:MAG: hypothetical protein Q9169_005724 [Polycauliona sp. 2 TL-2023]
MSPSAPRALLSVLLLGSILFALILNFARYTEPSSSVVAIDSDAKNPATLITNALSKIAVPFGSNSSHDLQFSSSHEDDLVELKKRALTWQQALDNGLAALNLLNGPRQQSSPWTQYQQLAENGWTVHDAVPEAAIAPITDDYKVPGGPYESLKIDPGNSFEVSVVQNQKFDNCYRKGNDGTTAAFTNIYNGPNGAIVAEANYGALQKLIKDKRNIPHPDGGGVATRLPDLRQWSDVVWLVWAQRVAADRKGLLKYVFRHNVATFATKGIMEQAVGVAHNGLDVDWPGKKFEKGTVGFQALLGTAHGKGVAFLVADHVDLRAKNVESVTVFTTDEGFDYHLLFTLTG